MPHDAEGQIWRLNEEEQMQLYLKSEWKWFQALETKLPHSYLLDCVNIWWHCWDYQRGNESGNRNNHRNSQSTLQIDVPLPSLVCQEMGPACRFLCCSQKWQTILSALLNSYFSPVLIFPPPHPPSSLPLSAKKAFKLSDFGQNLTLGIWPKLW